MGLDGLGNISDLMTGSNKSINQIPLSKIKPDPNQPRKDFDEEKLLELAESIKENGLLQPINVRETDDGYIINCGERRYQACLLIKKEEILAVIDNDFKTIGQLIENVSRVDLNLLERANFINELLEEQGLTQKEIANQLGHKDTSWVSRHATVAKAPKIIIDAIEIGQIESLEVAQTLTSKCKTDARWYRYIEQFLQELPEDQKFTTSMLREFISQAQKLIDEEDGQDVDNGASTNNNTDNSIDKKFTALMELDSASIQIVDEIVSNEEVLLSIELLEPKTRKALFSLLLEMNDDFNSEKLLEEWGKLTK